MSSLLKYWPLIATLVNFGTLWACWSLRQVAKTEAKALVDALRLDLTKVDEEAEAALDDHESRLTRTEKDVEAIRQDIAKLPTKTDLARLEGEVKAVGAQVVGLDKAVGAQVGVLDRGIGRLEGYFLQLGVEKAS